MSAAKVSIGVNNSATSYSTLTRSQLQDGKHQGAITLEFNRLQRSPDGLILSLKSSAVVGQRLDGNRQADRDGSSSAWLALRTCVATFRIRVQIEEGLLRSLIKLLFARAFKLSHELFVHRTQLTQKVFIGRIPNRIRIWLRSSANLS